MWHALDGVPREEALRHWRSEHAPEGGGLPYTGLGEVWFDSFEAAAEATTTPEWAAVIADADTFMDLNRVVAAWAEEHEIIPPV
jgi:hypothetical protein